MLRTNNIFGPKWNGWEFGKKQKRLPSSSTQKKASRHTRIVECVKCSWSTLHKANNATVGTIPHRFVKTDASKFLGKIRNIFWLQQDEWLRGEGRHVSQCINLLHGMFTRKGKEWPSQQWLPKRGYSSELEVNMTHCKPHDRGVSSMLNWEGGQHLTCQTLCSINLQREMNNSQDRSRKAFCLVQRKTPPNFRTFQKKGRNFSKKKS